MQIILITFFVFIAFWVMGILASIYHVFAFRFPSDKTVFALGIFLTVSGIASFLLINWVLAAYFGS